MAVSLIPQRRPVALAWPVAVPYEEAVAAVTADSHRLIGAGFRAHVDDGPGYTLLGVRIAGGRRITREVRVGFGPVLDDDGVAAVPVWWEDAQHPELFPTFDGGLELRAAPGGTELRLAGSYQPPLGAFGRFADEVIGHRIVTASLQAFLADTAARLHDAASSAQAPCGTVDRGVDV